MTPGSGSNDSPLDQTMPLPPSDYLSPGQPAYAPAAPSAENPPTAQYPPATPSPQAAQNPQPAQYPQAAQYPQGGQYPQAAQYPQAGYAGQPPYGQPPYGQPPYGQGVPPNKSKAWLWVVVGVLVVAIIVATVLIIVHNNNSKQPAASTATSQPTTNPTDWPTSVPTDWPTDGSTDWPTTIPTDWPTSVPTAAAFCTFYSLSLLDSPDLLGFVIDYASDNDSALKTINDVYQTFQSVLKMNPPSSVVSPVNDIIGIVSALKDTASQGSLTATQQAWSNQKSQYTTAFNNYQSAGKAACG